MDAVVKHAARTASSTWSRTRRPRGDLPRALPGARSTAPERSGEVSATTGAHSLALVRRRARLRRAGRRDLPVDRRLTGVRAASPRTTPTRSSRSSASGRARPHHGRRATSTSSSSASCCRCSCSSWRWARRARVRRRRGRGAARARPRVSRPAARRRRLGRAATVAAEVLAVSAAPGLALAVLDPIVGLDLPRGRLLAAIVALAALGLFFRLARPRSGRCLRQAVPSRSVCPPRWQRAGYLVNGLHGLAGWLDPFRVLSPFWLVGSSPLQSGSNGWGLLAVMLLAVLVLGVGSRRVERRDLQTP